MECYYPQTVWRARSGSGITFRKSEGWSDRRLQIRCGICIGCKVNKSQLWAVRCVHEAQLHKQNSFVTLTYNPESLPEDGSLDHTDFQKFAKRLRRDRGPFRFFMCGEYGDENRRPHYHVCLFGLDFSSDRTLHHVERGHRLYNSPSLDRIWGMGHCLIGDLTFDSAAYVARYITKKLSKPHDAESTALHEKQYGRISPYGEWYMVRPEYIQMSRNKGIGHKWIETFKTDVYPGDSVTINGKKFPTPRYYDQVLSEEELKNIKAKREQAVTSATPVTTDRLAVKEKCAIAKMANCTRTV